MPAPPARAEWRRAESPNFILYGDLSEAQIRQRIVQLEAYDRMLRIMTNVSDPPAPAKLHVYIVGGAEALRTVMNVPAGVAGFYMASQEGIGAFIDGRTDAGTEVLFHEYAHHFMAQYRPNAYPAWYIEGFAEYFMTAEITPRRIDIGRPSPGRAFAIVEGSWLPIDQVLFGEPQRLAGEARARFYAQSWLITHYFYSTPERQQALGRYLVAARSGEPAAALQTATGMDSAAFGQALRHYSRGSIVYRRMTRPENEPAPQVTVTIMSPGTGDLILYEGALRIGIQSGREADYLQRIRASAARYPDDPFARRVLAHAELLYGDAAVADRLLDALLATTPGDAQLMYLKGLRYLTAAENGDDFDRDARLARPWFSRAHRADANHFQTLLRYAQSLRTEPNYVSENTSNVLLLAYQLAPQVAGTRMNAAVMLMNLGEYDDAIGLLQPVSVDPHNASLAANARQLIEQARAAAADPARRRRPPPPSESPAS